MKSSSPLKGEKEKVNRQSRSKEEHIGRLCKHLRS